MFNKNFIKSRITSSNPRSHGRHPLQLLPCDWASCLFVDVLHGVLPSNVRGAPEKGLKAHSLTPI